ncbi:MAG: carbamate kinase [Dehalococcoidia bacterium]|nr:carbamate kinase [Dehalococcoidia bacterium]
MTSGGTTVPLVVVGVGGNALSPPGGSQSIEDERKAVTAVARELASLARTGQRLLIVHGNGPQAGRLLEAEQPETALDAIVAQTQGELGYLIGEAVDAELGADSTVALITRVLVDSDDPALAEPTKPIGPVLAEAPVDGPAVRQPDGSGWRRVVASPRPEGVVELEAIRVLLERWHVIAGGGGGVALSEESETGGRSAVPAIVDKDYVASMLARALGAEELVFVTDVPTVFESFGAEPEGAVRRMSVAEARALLASGACPAGSMGPKVESCIEFVEATGGRAVITTVGEVEAALRGEAGTTVRSAPG